MAEGTSGGLDPIKQFEIHPAFDKFGHFKLFGYDLTFTNSALMMVVAVVLISVFLFTGTSKKALVPGRLQSMAEISYEFVANMIRSTAGRDGLKFFPFIYALFMFILFANVLGLVPFFFTTTSHIIVTVALALMVFFTVIIVGFWKHGFKFLKLFVPSGVPVVVLPFVVLLVLSYMFSPQINWWWFQKHPPELPLESGLMLLKYFPFYRELSAKNKKRFGHRVAMYIEDRAFQAQRGEEEGDVSLELKTIVAA
ncbi:MAG: F0F1 ATP synthase subunit A, partial [Robiginitomaculum sp.]|nr:F0F1 ATP synthase subunit A [Robiginitomaculum sp.]